MPPTLSVCYVANGRLADAKHCSHASLRDSAGNSTTDRRYAFSIELREWMSVALAAKSGGAPLARHVSHVFRGCPEKKMTWVHAASNVTVMQNE